MTITVIYRSNGADIPAPRIKVGGVYICTVALKYCRCQDLHRLDLFEVCSLVHGGHFDAAYCAMDNQANRPHRKTKEKKKSHGGEFLCLLVDSHH